MRNVIICASMINVVFVYLIVCLLNLLHCLDQYHVDNNGAQICPAIQTCMVGIQPRVELHCG
jgi:hypothetical protein